MEDDGTNDLLVGDVVRTNELQVWFLSEHLVDVTLVRPRLDSYQTRRLRMSDCGLCKTRRR